MTLTHPSDVGGARPPNVHPPNTLVHREKIALMSNHLNGILAPGNIPKEKQALKLFFFWHSNCTEKYS